MARPKVVILSAFLTPYRSGAEACVEEVSRLLVSRYSITIVTARMRRSLPRHDRMGEVPILRVGFGFGFDKWLYPFLAPFAVRKLQPQLIHAVLETFAGLALHLCRFTVPNARRLLTLQTLNRSFLKGLLVRSPHAVTAISSALQSTARDFGRAEVTVIPNGIDLKNVELRSAKCEKVPGRILFVGRLEPMKGVDVLLEALSRVGEKYPQAHLRIVGEGSLREKLEARSSKRETRGRVIFLGYIPPPAVYDEFAQAQIFCGPSRSEALGNVFLEAQAAGCAVIGTNIGGIPEIVEDGVTGLLVDPNDAEAAARALSTLLRDGELRSRLAGTAKQKVGQFDWGQIAERYKQVYDRLLF